MPSDKTCRCRWRFGFWFASEGLHASRIDIREKGIMATWQGSSQHHATRSALLLSACVLAAVMGTRWVRLNVSPSVPLGLYRLTSLPTPLRQGMLVVLPVPSTVQHWHSAWLPLLKPVAAVAGEEVCDRWGHLWVAGIWYGPIYPEAAGRSEERR